MLAPSAKARGMSQYGQDLFGNVDVPKRRTKAREEYAQKIKLQQGLTYWSLAPDCLAAGVPDFVECLWAVDHENRFVRIIVDLRNGELWNKAAREAYDGR